MGPSPSSHVEALSPSEMVFGGGGLWEVIRVDGREAGALLIQLVASQEEEGIGICSLSTL